MKISILQSNLMLQKVERRNQEYLYMNKTQKLLWLLLILPTLVTAQGRAANVVVTQASLQLLAPVIVVPGTVISRSDAKLAAEVTGQLLDVAEVGTVAAKGDVVARIEDTVIKLRRDELLAEVERARARLRFLEKEEQRYVKLADSNLAAATKLEETRSDRDVSRGDLRIAEARLMQVDDQLQRTNLRTPFDGIVVARLAMPGERVEIGKNVVRIVDQQHLEIIARAPLEYYSFVQPGQQLRIRTGSVEVTGMVRTVVAVGSENTHQFELRLDIESNRFPVGQTVRVSVPVSTARKVLVVPRDALVLRPEGISVFIVDEEKKAQQIMVTTGIDAGEEIEVNGDLKDGDTVIIRGNERIRSGQTVSINQG
jgi:RND family efflux transporter MFP subunit